MAKNNQFMSSAETAARLNIHRSTLTRWVQQGKIAPVIKGDGVRGAMFFERKEVARVQKSLIANIIGPNGERAA